MASAMYDITTGEFSIFDDPDDGGVERAIYVTNGYAGRGHCMDNPDCQSRKNEGPLPIGRYHLRVVDDPRPTLNRPVFRLTPFPGVEQYGRSGFLIHGGLPRHLTGRAGEASSSKGCIILSRGARQVIAQSPIGELEVCATVRPQAED